MNSRVKNIPSEARNTYQLRWIIGKVSLKFLLAIMLARIFHAEFGSDSDPSLGSGML
jgi:hypothetical protein